MTEKIFWTEPYLAALDTTIASASGGEVILRSTIFYAFSGGQESDCGTVGGFPVLEARTEGSDIVHVLPAGHGLKAGDPVRVEIDWARRHSLMRLHFAAELVLALFCRKLPGVEKIGAHIAEDKARLDFALGESVGALLPGIAAAANALVDADREIASAFSDEKNGRRYWEIEGFSRVPCGGTHIRRTGEVGHIKLKRNNIGRGKERVEIFLT